MKKKYRKITSALLCILAITMIVLAFPIQAFADEPNESTGPSVLEPTAVIPNPDYDPDADEGSLGTPSLESIPGAGAVDPMVIDPPGGGLIPIGPPNDPIASGVYTIVSYSNQKVVDVESGGTTAGTKVQQRSASTSVDRNQLFKIAFLTTVNNQHYYSVRSMTNSALSLSAPSANGNVTLQPIATTDTYSSIDANVRWVITAVDTGVYTFQNANSLGGYLSNGGSTTDGQQLITVSSSSSNCFWTLEQYDGDILQGYGWNSAHTTLIPGETATYSAYMYSSIVNRNGPVTYSLYKDFEAVSDYATINASTGAVTAIKSGDIQVRALPYPNAPELIYINVEVILEDGIIHTFKNVTQNSLLHPAQNSTSNLLTLQEYDYTKSSLMWVIEDVGNGYYKIRSEGTELYLESPGNSVGDAPLSLSTYNENSEPFYLWYFTKTSDGHYMIQSKYQRERTTDAPLYVTFSGGFIVQNSDTTNAKWDLTPLVLRVNVMYDQSFADRFGTEYANILHEIFADHSMRETFKIYYGFAFRVSFDAIPHQSYPYIENCVHKNDLDTICHDCKNNSNSDEFTECLNGYHHKNETRILDSVPCTDLLDSAQVNILFTGYNTCYAGTDEDSGSQFHQDVPYAYGWAVLNYNSVAIIAFTLYTDITSNTTDKYDKIIETITHELSHNLGADHCNDNGYGDDCIMGKSTPTVIRNLIMCDTCQTTINNNKLKLYNHQ